MIAGAVAARYRHLVYRVARLNGVSFEKKKASLERFINDVMPAFG
ncbi:MAG: hypothetical protein AB8B64_18545 [Granulosicoccus sp.]